MNKSLPIVAIVGQPNVGKSTLLNKIGKRHLAITSEVAGTTRDRQYMETEWNGVNFILVDTAGLTLSPKDQLELSLNKQIDVALAEADAIIFVVDGKESRSAITQTTVQKFRKIKKPVILAVNKLDSSRTRDEKLAEFKSLGIKPAFGISSVSGSGIGDLLDEVAEAVKDKNPQTDAETETSADSGIAIAIVGKPNVENLPFLTPS